MGRRVSGTVRLLHTRGSGSGEEGEWDGETT